MEKLKAPSIRFRCVRHEAAAGFKLKNLTNLDLIECAAADRSSPSTAVESFSRVVLLPNRNYFTASTALSRLIQLPR